MRIKAALALAPELPFSIEECELEDPGPGEALVRVVACGICHTDLVVKRQYVPIPLPMVLGHEGAGVIEKLGPGMEDFAVGDHVLMSFASCGGCAECTAHHPAYCDHFLSLNLAGARQGGSGIRRACEPVGGAFFAQSSFASHALAGHSNLIKVDRDLPLSLLAPLGCGIQTGMGTVLNVLAPRSGDSLAVFGTGPVGLAGVIAGAIAGCRIIIAIDIKPERLALARELGATHTIDTSQGDTSQGDVVAAIRAITGDTGVDCAFDSTGVPAVVTQAYRSLRKRGRAACVAAPPAGTQYQFDAYDMLNSGASIQGVIEGDAAPREFIPRLVEYYRQSRLPLEKLVTTYPFAAIEQAIHDSETGITLKAVLVMDC